MRICDSRSVTVLFALMLVVVPLSSVSAQSRTLQRGYWSNRAGEQSAIECGNLSEKAETLTLRLLAKDGRLVSEQAMILPSLGAEQTMISLPHGSPDHGSYEVQGSCSVGVITCHTVVYQRSSNDLPSTSDSPPPGRETDGVYYVPGFESVRGVQRGVIRSMLEEIQQEDRLVVFNLEASPQRFTIRSLAPSEPEVEAEFFSVPPSSLVEVVLPAVGEGLGVFELSPQTGDAVYSILHLRSVGAAPRRTYSIPRRAPACPSGPMALVMSNGAVNSLEVANYSPGARSFAVTFHDRSGREVERTTLRMESMKAMQVSVPSSPNEEEAIASARLECEEAAPLGMQVTSYAPSAERRGPLWILATQPLEPPATEEQHAVVFVNTLNGELNSVRYLEWSEILTECDMQVRESEGGVVSEEEVSLAPGCRSSVPMQRHASGGFLGLATTTTDTKGASYSAEILRTFRSARGEAIAVIAIPAVLAPRLGSLGSLVAQQDPEILRCMDEVQTSPPRQSPFISESDRQRFASNAYRLATEGDQKAEVGDIDGAIASYRRAILGYPKFECGRKHLIELLYRKRDLEGSQKESLELLEVNARSGYAHSYLALVAFEQGKFGAAVEHYKMAISLDPDLLHSYHGLAAAHLSLANYREALQMAEQGLGRDPEHLVLLQLGANAAELLNDEPTRRSLRTRVLGLAAKYRDMDAKELPHNLTKDRVEMIIAQAEMDVGDKNRALEALLHAQSLNPKAPSLHHALAQVYRELGKIEESENAARAGLAVNPEDHGVRFELGLSLYERGQWEDALKEFTTLSQNPAYTRGAKINIGRALSSMGRSAEALETYRSIEEQFPGEPWSRNNSALLYQELGEYGQAEQKFREAIERAPHSAEMRNNFGVLLDRLNRMVEAHEQTKQAVDLAPESALYRNNLGWILLRTSKYSEAIEQFELALKLDPTFSKARYNLDTARSYQKALEPQSKGEDDLLDWIE